MLTVYEDTQRRPSTRPLTVLSVIIWSVPTHDKAGLQAFKACWDSAQLPMRPPNAVCCRVAAFSGGHWSDRYGSKLLNLIAPLEPRFHVIATTA